MADRNKETLYGLLSKNRSRLYMIAEAGLNHGGSKERALSLVRAARWAGADAVKFQTAPTPGLTPMRTSTDRKAPKLSGKLDLSRDVFCALAREAARLEIDFLATPFDEESAGFFDELEGSAFKIAPGDLAKRPLVEAVGSKNKPVLLSTEMSSGEDIERAIGWMHTQSNPAVILMHGISSYPAQPEELDVKSVKSLQDRFGLPVGFCDYSGGSIGSTVAVSVSLGAQVIERHFRVEARADVADLLVSLDAKQLKIHIAELRTIETILGTGSKFAAEVASETESRAATPRAGAVRRKSAAPSS